MIVTKRSFVEFVGSIKTPVVLTIYLELDGSCFLAVSDSALPDDILLGTARGTVMKFKTLARLRSVLDSFASSLVSFDLVLTDF